jgi:hypothetical protein
VAIFVLASGRANLFDQVIKPMVRADARWKPHPTRGKENRLLVAQCFHRIQPRGFDRRINPKEQANAHRSCTAAMTDQSGTAEGKLGNSLLIRKADARIPVRRQ